MQETMTIQMEESLPTQQNKPLFIMMCGLPGSGKSTVAHQLNIRTQNGGYISPVVLSSDSVREEFFGNAADQSHNETVFRILHRRMIDELRMGHSVVFDATNLSHKRRIHDLQSFSRLDCYRICILMATEYSVCVSLNKNRDRIVPDDAMFNMLKKFQPPAKNEGFDEVFIVYSALDSAGNVTHRLSDLALNYTDYVYAAESFDQENHHHSLTLGQHCRRAAHYVHTKVPNNYLLMYAAAIHDAGKIVTKTRVNAKGVNDGDCHYYGHECVGAYLSLFYIQSMISNCTTDDVLYMANLISYHMRPYTAWKSSEQAYQRDLERCGRAFMEDVELLHEADLHAH